MNQLPRPGWIERWGAFKIKWKIGDMTERWYPCFVGVLAGLITFVLLAYGWQTIPKTIKDLFSAVVNVAAIAVGFLGAIKSIVFAIDSRPIIQKMKKAGLFQPFIRYLVRAIYLCLVLAGVTGLLLLVDPSTPPARFDLMVDLWLGLLVTTSLACFRVINIMGRILNVLANEIEPQA